MAADSKAKFTSYKPAELRELYQKNPVLFTELADDAISQACIGKTQQGTLKLQQLQWTIAGQLRKAKTPLRRMQIMENIFYAEVFGDDGQLVQLRSACIELVRAITGTDQASNKKSGTRLVKK